MEINKDGKLISSRTNKEIVIYDVNVDRCFNSKRNPEELVFILNWDSNIGFGQLTFIQKENGSIDCESETMCDNNDKLFIKYVLNKFIEKLNIIE